MEELFALQQQLARAVRQPELAPPAGVSADRLAVYRELVLNNVSGFIQSTFPVLRQICGASTFDAYIALFFRQSQLDSPYFVDIPQFFLEWLQAQACQAPLEPLPLFASELAHYEWLELDLYRRHAHWPLDQQTSDAELNLQSELQLTPLLEVQTYQYPVHQLSVHYQPTAAPTQPTFLALYRDAQQQVKFLQLTALSSASLQLLQQQPSLQAVLDTLTPLVPGLAVAELSEGLLALAQQLLDVGIARLAP